LIPSGTNFVVLTGLLLNAIAIPLLLGFALFLEWYKSYKIPEVDSRHDNSKVYDPHYGQHDDKSMCSDEKPRDNFEAWSLKVKQIERRLRNLTHGKG
jgi:hypothetical protein